MFRASQEVQWLRICLPSSRHRFSPWIGELSWSRKWQPAPGFLPGKFHRWNSLEGYSPWGCKKSNTTKHTHTHFMLENIFPMFFSRNFMVSCLKFMHLNKWELVFVYSMRNCHNFSHFHVAVWLSQHHLGRDWLYSIALLPLLS